MTNPRHHPLFRKGLSLLLTVCFVYQLGACPCGCLEHNYWFQAMRLTDHDHSHHHVADAVHNGTCDPRLNHGHDCTGAAAAVFVDNSRAVRWVANSVAGWTNCLIDDAAIQLASQRGYASLPPPDHFSQDTAASRLQVFRL